MSTANGLSGQRKAQLVVESRDARLDFSLFNEEKCMAGPVIASVHCGSPARVI